MPPLCPLAPHASSITAPRSPGPFTTWKPTQLLLLIVGTSFELSGNKSRKGNVINVRTVIKRKKLTVLPVRHFFP